MNEQQDHDDAMRRILTVAQLYLDRRLGWVAAVSSIEDALVGEHRNIVTPGYRPEVQT